ncbi:MAG: hypothetical protein WBN48_00420 [Thiogranum sp.]
MDEKYKILGTAPWSNQNVNKPVQFLAWVLTISGIFAVGSNILFSFKEGIAIGPILFYLGIAVALIYYLFIFSHVAIRGKAPSGWLPRA